MKIVENLPETFKGIILMVAGFALLFHTLGVLGSFLWFALIIASAYLIVIGFIKARGVQAVKCIIKREDQVCMSAQEAKRRGIYKEGEDIK